MSRVIRQPSLPQRQRRDTQILLVILVGLLIALTACAVAQTQVATPTSVSTSTPTTPPQTVAPTLTLLTPTPTKPPPPEDWQYRWLKKILCSAPCVEGITPGKTTATEAVELLSQNPLVENVKKNSNYSVPLKLGRVSWDWTGSRNTSRGGALYSTDTSEVIFSISPQFAKSYSLREVMQAYGEPTHIVATAYIPASEQIVLCRDVTLLYVSYGIRLYYDNCRTQIELDETLSFSIITFFVPDTPYQVGSSTGRSHPDWLLLWQGFKGFDYYCRDEWASKLCRGEVQ